MTPFGQLTDSIRPPQWRGPSRVLRLLGNDETLKFTPKKYLAKKPQGFKPWTVVKPGSAAERQMHAQPFDWKAPDAVKE